MGPTGAAHLHSFVLHSYLHPFNLHSSTFESHDVHNFTACSFSTVTEVAVWSLSISEYE